MEGAAAAELKRYDLAIVGAWHTAVFALSMYGGKMKGKKLSDFLSGERSTEPKNQAAQAVAFFRNMKEAGFPVEIKRVVH